MLPYLSPDKQQQTRLAKSRINLQMMLMSLSSWVLLESVLMTKDLKKVWTQVSYGVDRRLGGVTPLTCPT